MLSISGFLSCLRVFAGRFNLLVSFSELFEKVFPEENWCKFISNRSFTKACDFSFFSAKLSEAFSAALFKAFSEAFSEAVSEAFQKLF